MLDKLYKSKAVAADTETTGLHVYGSIVRLGYHPARPFAFSFTSYDGENAYIRFEVNPYTREVLYRRNMPGYLALKHFFESTPNIVKVFHNANFDVTMLLKIGIKVVGPVFDTLVMSHVHNPNRFAFGLKPLCKELFNWSEEDQKDLLKTVETARRAARKVSYAISADSKSKTRQWFNPLGDPEADYWLGDAEKCETYALGDTDRTMALYTGYEDFYEEVPEDGSQYDSYRPILEMENELLSVTREMQLTGIKLDFEKVLELEQYYQGIIDSSEKAKADLGYGNLNPGSPIQMKATFYGKGKGQFGLRPEYKRRKRKDGIREETLTTDGTTLAKWAKNGNELAKVLVNLSGAEHQLGSFIAPFKRLGVWEGEDFVLHPNFRTCGTVTGRLSCSEPNLMNISSATSIKRKGTVDYRIRECFVPRKDHVLYFFDYSQIEIWILAFNSKDPVMVENLLGGRDMHSYLATSLFGTEADFGDKKAFDNYRKKAKTVNFTMPYGGGPSAIAEQLLIDYSEAKQLYDGYWRTYRGVFDYNRKLMTQIQMQGWIKDNFGRVYVIDPRFAYKALNYDTQGPAAGVIKRAMNNVANVFRTKYPGCRTLLTVHDELGMEIPLKHHSKRLGRDITKAMQGNLHTYFGMPSPFIIEPSVTETSWAQKVKLEL